LAAECRLNAVISVDVFAEIIGASNQHRLATTMHQFTPDHWTLGLSPTVSTACLLQPLLQRTPPTRDVRNRFFISVRFQFGFSEKLGLGSE